MTDTFQDVRVSMEQLGSVYRAIYETYGDSVSITYLDPRNTSAILIYFLRHWRFSSLGLFQALHRFLTKAHPNTLFYNGHILNPSAAVNEEEILARLAYLQS
ncbi:hypothetical protein [Sinobaca sp. H24]|uniref:hypothetical protein n=1 Tax=Sinobaca sp. H24 TaxID=2923376 RepID=UPI00207977FA|nr:hypothetical protein [Sinobaca sp. H24]